MRVWFEQVSGMRAERGVQRATTIEEVLCSRDAGLCADFDRQKAAFGGAMFSSDGCAEVSQELLFLRSVLEGRPDWASCRGSLSAAYGGPLGAEDARALCGLWAQDFRDGGDRLCREAAANVYNGRRISYEDCGGHQVFALGEAACGSKFSADSGVLRGCLFRARIARAASERDRSRCGADMTCLATFGDARICEPGPPGEDFEGFCRRFADWNVPVEGS